jgi:hypothetical protein
MVATFFRGVLVLAVCAVFVGWIFPLAFASSTDGTIPLHNYAWGDQVGWVNFGASNGNVHVTNSGLTGYAWSVNYGWINLSPTNSGVKNDGAGNLSGYAWGGQLGWINFSGVKINSSGIFTGSALVSNFGQIKFDCTNCGVLTDWRSAAPSGGTPTGGGGGGGTGYYNPPTPPAPSPTPTAIQAVLQTIKSILSSLLPHAAPPQAPPLSVEQIVPRIAPPAFHGLWDLVSLPTIGNFVLSPLPKEISFFTEKFPALKQTFQELGVTGAASLPKLQGVELTLSGLGKSAGLPQGKITSGKMVLSVGMPLTELSPQAKQGIPTEVVFARSSDEKIDFDIKLSLNSRGQLEKRIAAVAGSMLKLIVKPEAPAQSVKGYLVLRSRERTSGIGGNNRGISLQTALASLVFASPVLSQNVPPETVGIEQKLALTEFVYTDEGDGIYTANVRVPNVDGQYDIITLIRYKDPERGTKEIGLTAVVDPEGYVYEEQGGKQTRIPQAAVSLFRLNPATNKYELWPAKTYSQENPQVTGITGTYAFLVPAGTYHIAVQAPGYKPYIGLPFGVETGNQIHDNIELHSSNWWAGWDWKTTFLVLVGALLVANFYWDRRRKRLLMHNH